ncbi:MAG: hypothetical protein ACJAWW_000275 [Sulfurimonas sp.]|jgi:uncharacterized protein (DUF302 family)
MKSIYSILITTFVALSIGFSGCAASSLGEKTVTKAVSGESVQVFTTKNTDGKITPKSISKAFDENGLTMGGNNDMNKPFKLRFNKVNYDTYNLAMFRNNALSIKLVKKYPHFGRLVPLTMSIWSDGDTMNVSTLTLAGLARAANASVTDPDLIAYSVMIKKALKAAMPNGIFKELNHKVLDPKASYELNFSAKIDAETDPDEWREDFESEFEGEMESIGFLFPNYINMNDELFDEVGYEAYDFYITYSVCKFDVIFPVSKDTPEAGAYAPCSIYVYKKKGENKVHVGYLGVNNWIKTLDIKDEHAIMKLKEAESSINKILTELTE